MIRDFFFLKMFKNELLIKYTEFVYGIYRNVHKMYTKRILSVYIFLIGTSLYQKYQ
ncbi:hypothetical protein GLOIN_2v1636977 [Rhizophagus irregularis DAOM 181602=DAOM 197198]|uniref:Uncharacterized protein n=1 Tax=Rhizophagus irregularis (strain DAOM 181602 / DAOM 197198 / MUCL 43194) TaxID=747089 RepID=A0A2P4PSW8_RHIID|nr:hypothetical protein GLOIN_2v1636977 [Rhizophagus irregularis DAOM 181602=DAOM 197198]POG68484.1 hypothetical protein GLOIN_2v1636977 [Rhizophagus irregularis DAOM 181602=DAOM 197198]|eukprot:XP_025175350.1 hypothetical protein GLOIN_2v1636977 [Rhizophagus irregularis DAOM 181602=DAOM 197198]